MASWAGAYGAGGAADALEKIVAQRFLERKQAELERAQRVQEAQQQAELAQRAELAREGQRMQLTNLSAERDERYQDRTLRTGEFNSRLQRETQQDQLRAKERADDRSARDTEREDEQAFRSGETRSRQAFERSLMGLKDSAAPSEPLVAIKDPVTGQPTLVPRSQAAGKAPASTRDQALTEGQSNAAGFADRMKFNEGAIQGFETGAADRWTAIKGAITPRDFQSSERQKYDAAKKNWIAAQLRKESGAAISEGEYAEADRQYFPQPGDGAETVKQKRELRKLAQDSMRRASGHGAAAAALGAGQATDTPLGNDLGAEW